MTPELRFSKPSDRYPLLFKRILKVCAFVINRRARRIRSQQARDFLFYEFRIYAKWMTRKRVRVLEGLCLYMIRLIYNSRLGM